MLILTYTFTHNHPGPNSPTTNQTHDPALAPAPVQLTSPKQEPEQEQDKSMTNNEGASDYPQFPFNSSLDLITNHDQEKNSSLSESSYINVVFDEEPLSYPHLMTFSSTKSQEDDFFDELEELPTSSYSSPTSFMMCNFFEDRILVNPSWSSSN